MAGRFGKPNATGRSSGKLAGRESKLRKPPKGEPWTWLTRELLFSPAWRAMSLDARRLIDFLLVEHCNHAGRENGQLIATHRQLIAIGILPSNVRRAIETCESLGLIRWQMGGRNIPSRFRLTFYADAAGGDPTDEWKAITPDLADRFTRRYPRRKAPVREDSPTKSNSAATASRGNLPPRVVAMDTFRPGARV